MNDPRVSDNHDTTTRTPRWVWVMSLILGGVILVLVVVMLLPGGGHGPGRHSTSSNGDTHSPSVDAQGVAGVFGRAADPGASGRTVEVVALDTMAFEPDSVTVSVGEVVTFVLTNAGETVHEWMLGDPAMHQRHDGDTFNGVLIQPGETKHLTWQFDQAGRIEYGCHLPGHYEGGMRGEVTIQ